MSEQINKCPYCAEEIPADAVRCPSCGEILQRKNTLSKNMLKPILAIILFVFAIGMLILGCNLYQNRYRVEEIPYKSISYVVTDLESLSQKYSARDLLNKIIEQDEDLSEYMQGKHSEKEKTGVFRLYYKNLELLADSLNYDDDYTGPKVDLTIESTSTDANRIIINKLRKYKIIGSAAYNPDRSYNSDDMADYFKIENPKTELIEIIYEGEGFNGFHINDSYIANSYAKYLNKSWQDYINNKKRIYDDLEHNNYFDDGYIIPDSITVAKWAIMWDRFLKKYPNFELKKEIQTDIGMYSNDILYRKYRADYKDGKEILADYVREGCEYYLKHADKNSAMYKKIQKDYKTWEDNNFEYNDNTNKL